MEEEKNIILLESWGKPNVQGRTYYCKSLEDKDNLLITKKITPGDVAIVSEDQSIWMANFDNGWDKW